MGRLNDQQADEARKLLAAGQSVGQIAAAFGIHRLNIVRLRDDWAERNPEAAYQRYQSRLAAKTALPPSQR